MKRGPTLLATVAWMAFSILLPTTTAWSATPEQIYSRVLGCLVGSAIGDAFGGVVEFADAARVKRLAGKDWVDQFLPYGKDHRPHPWGVWEAAPPRGTSTDDTRMNQVLVECVIRNQGYVSPQFLAIEYIERYRDREKFYPRHAALAEEHLSWFLERACTQLGLQELPSGKAITPEKEPSLMGLISLAPVGLLYCGQPERAYRKAFDLDFLDVGHARDATAMLAAMISAALQGNSTAREMVEAGLRTDPFAYGENRPVAKSLRKFLQIADQAPDDRALVQALAAEVKDWNVFNPIEALAVPAAAVCYSKGDFVRSIVIAANGRELDGKGHLVKLRDVDCAAGVAGALVGALRGVEALPPDWVRDTLQANKTVYGIDLESNAKRFCEAVYGAKR
jgi:ADP-ribosylglycohydrolase